MCSDSLTCLEEASVKLEESAEVKKGLWRFRKTRWEWNVVSLLAEIVISERVGSFRRLMLRERC